MSTTTQRTTPRARPTKIGAAKPFTRADLVNAVAEHADLPKTKADLVVTAMLGAIEGALRQGSEVRLTGFGTFATGRRKATTGRNPQTGEPISLDESVSVRFRPGKGLKSAVASA